MASTETARSKPVPAVAPAWQSADTCDRVKALIYEEYGRQKGQPEVKPLYEDEGTGRWRVNFREGAYIGASFRVIARLTPNGLVKVKVAKDRRPATRN